MRGRGEHALDGGKFFRDERRDLLQARAVDEHQQVVAAGHEVAGFHLVELADALGQAVEAAAAFGRDAHLDDGADDAGILVREVQHRAEAQQHAVFFSSSSWRFTSASDRLSTCAICAVFRLPPSSKSLTIGFIGREFRKNPPQIHTKLAGD
jgi:hypothetical protein